MYGIGIFIRNQLYDLGILPSASFNKSVISIGNLSAGGTGKTPMTEYLIRLLKENHLIATLSRGYKRHTSGFLLAEKDSTSFQVGDEPLQFKKKFPDTIISVDENRAHGIKQLLTQFPELKVILLDDAFQHRRVKPGLSILLTDYGKMYYDDFLLPAGTLREWSGAKKRADVIVVTKCPDNLTPVEKRIIFKKISPEPHQHVFFSHIKYGEAKPILNPSRREGLVERPLSLMGREGEGLAVILLTGISNPAPLEDHLKSKGMNVITQSYPDHHEYTIVEVNKAAELFKSIPSKNKVIITTEKDAMRLDKPGLMEILERLPVYYIPIETTFDAKEKEDFNKTVINYVIRTNQKNSGVH